MRRTVAVHAMTDAVFAPVRDSFRAIAGTIVPEARVMGESEWEELEGIVERGLASRPLAVKKQLRILVRLLDLLPLVRWGRTFRALDEARRTRFLLAIENAPLLLLRRGFWGLRTLVYMGFYGRAEAAAAIGYRANVHRGWVPS